MSEIFIILFLLLSVVPFGKNNIYTMPCDITFWGRPENEQDVLQRMRRHGYILRTFREPIPQKSGASGPNYSRAVMGVGRPPSIKINQDQVSVFKYFFLVFINNYVIYVCVRLVVSSVGISDR